MGKYFGTDGFRGEANVTLTVDHAFKVGRFLGWYYGKTMRMVRQRLLLVRIQEEVVICLSILW